VVERILADRTHDRGSGARFGLYTRGVSGFDFGPPLPINQDAIHVERTVDASGHVVTHYRNPAYHLQGREGGFTPPPPSAQLEELEASLFAD
jgi:hypothetical protein